MLFIFNDIFVYLSKTLNHLLWAYLELKDSPSHGNVHWE